MARGGAGTTYTRPHQLGENTPIDQIADGMFPAGCGSSLYWQTLTTQKGVPGGQQSIPCFLPSLVGPFFTCTSLTSISCSDSVPTSLMPASISSLSALPYHLLATSRPTCFRINLLQDCHKAAARAFLSACHGSCEDPTPSQFWISKQETSSLLPLLMNYIF